MLTWLSRNTPFPPPARALQSPNGLLAAGGDLSPQRLLSAYSQGIFPWYSEGEPILWWSPDPRMVLFPAEFRISHSLAKTLRKGRHEVRFDSAFAAVMQACAAPRRGQDGTWITGAMRAAYLGLHRLGYAHSVETWIDGELAGGLYGVALGRMFFGESMFTQRSDCSKVALAHLVRRLVAWNFCLIDCQMVTGHLASLGAHPISRVEFNERLAELVNLPGIVGSWRDADREAAIADEGAAR